MRERLIAYSMKLRKMRQAKKDRECGHGGKKKKYLAKRV